MVVKAYELKESIKKIYDEYKKSVFTYKDVQHHLDAFQSLHRMRRAGYLKYIGDLKITVHGANPGTKYIRQWVLTDEAVYYAGIVKRPSRKGYGS